MGILKGGGEIWRGKVDEFGRGVKGLILHGRERMRREKSRKSSILIKFQMNKTWRGKGGQEGVKSFCGTRSGESESFNGQKWGSKYFNGLGVRLSSMEQRQI